MDTTKIENPKILGTKIFPYYPGHYYVAYTGSPDKGVTK